MEYHLSIDEVAKRTGLTAYTLRYYERIGLIAPVGRAAGGRRRYEASDMAWIEFLLRLRTTHMPIGKMQMLAIGLSSLAGAAETVYSGFQSPVGIATIPGKAVYISDWSANTVTRIDIDGARTVVAKNEWLTGTWGTGTIYRLQP
ncbi:MerR family DNA-binding transcriptional regulator [Brenneria tiliae]|uniref:MerR family DNA-binding transcriptional regulator n=1 Tax=Brenneria tiliae TaxID=2914984 RepID=A0ABT0MXD6_9GAMM|nr:MerR family DNA-binding transcriptional regulator [Brenneria tiliae]MCL2894510.1 MerR family DNA-binding transcriptional regulator [Brenneria tiliae]